MQNGEWQLWCALQGLDASTLLPPGLLHRDRAAARPAPQLHVEATANGYFGAGGSELRRARRTLLPPGWCNARRPGSAVKSPQPTARYWGPAHLQLNVAGEQLTLDLESPQLRSHGTLQGWPERPLQDVDLDLAVTLLPVSLAHLAHLAPMGRLSLGGALGFARPRGWAPWPHRGWTGT